MAQLINNGADATLNVADLVSDISELYGKQAWATTGIGYATGAGAAVTQATSKATTVVLNKMCGVITTHNQSLAAGASVAFVLQNSAIGPLDNVNVNRCNNTGTEGAYRVFVDRTLSGNAVIILENRSAGALAEALQISFAVVKVVNA